jgi:hypothetical protein
VGIKDADMVFSGFHRFARRCVSVALAASPFMGDDALLDMLCYTVPNIELVSRYPLVFHPRLI